MAACTFVAMEPDKREDRWKAILEMLEPQFGGDLDLQAVLFIIGLQELGHGFKTYKKDQKLDIMHVAVCSLLEPYGFYEFQGRDADGWPHWNPTSKLPHLKPAQQHRLMQDAVIEYFERAELI